VIASLPGKLPVLFETNPSLHRHETPKSVGGRSPCARYFFFFLRAIGMVCENIWTSPAKYWFEKYVSSGYLT
jgi:hypothetical protein